MMPPPRRLRTSCAWRVRHPPPEHVALGGNCTPMARKTAQTHARHVWPSPSSGPSRAAGWKALGSVRLARVWRACWGLGHPHVLRAGPSRTPLEDHPDRFQEPRVGWRPMTTQSDGLWFLSVSSRTSVPAVMPYARRTTRTLATKSSSQGILAWRNLHDNAARE